MIYTNKVEVRTDIVPLTLGKRSGQIYSKKGLVVHSTANLNSTPQNERDWLLNPLNEVNASWNECVGEHYSLIAIPHIEHAVGTSKPHVNRSYIHIEMCESGDRLKTYGNFVVRCAEICIENDWGVMDITTHHSHTGKNCPRALINNLQQFYTDVEDTIDFLKDMKPLPIEDRVELLEQKFSAMAHELVRRDGKINDLERLVNKMMEG